MDNLEEKKEEDLEELQMELEAYDSENASCISGWWMVLLLLFWLLISVKR